MCKIRHLKLSSGCWSILVLGKDKAVGALDLNFKDEGIGGAFYLDGGVDAVGGVFVTVEVGYVEGLVEEGVEK